MSLIFRHQLRLTHCANHILMEKLGIMVHPFDPYIVTSGDDNTLRYWDINKRELARSVEPVSGSHKKISSIAT